MNARAIKLSDIDNVAVLPDGAEQDIVVEGLDLTANSKILAGHKIAVCNIAKKDSIVKYGQIIGFASEPIVAGDHVHTHNCTIGDVEKDYAFGTDLTEDTETPSETRYFKGFRRENGSVGTRNYIGILTSVNCSASVARFIAEEAEKSGILEPYGNIDGIVPLVHGTGCGMAADGDGYDNLHRALWGYASHPNFSAVLMVGLGCEVFQISRFMEMYDLKASPRFQHFTIQGSGGTRKTVEAGIAAVKAMLPMANNAERVEIPASELTLALQCGGSDGYSGISANPALGYAADLLVRQGGTAILSETPEVYGAEHLLTRRAVSEKVGRKLLERIEWWEDYAARNGGEMNNNPSPGNKAGGLTTILEKSLGAVAKGGRSPLQDVYRYAEKIRTKGFVFMDSPGYDPASVTGQVASGANIVCFTTGRGSAFGYKPSPSIKLATNTAMYQRMTDDMDINCGDIIDGNSSIEEKGQEIFEYFLNVASGNPSKSEELGYGNNEFVPWQIGAVM
jgi:arabinonate dehydratase